MIDGAIQAGNRRETSVMLHMEGACSEAAKKAKKQIEEYMDALDALDVMGYEKEKLLIERLKLQRKYRPENKIINILDILGADMASYMEGKLKQYIPENSHYVCNRAYPFDSEIIDMVDWLLFYGYDFMQDDITKEQIQHIRYDETLHRAIKTLFRNIAFKRQKKDEDGKKRPASEEADKGITDVFKRFFGHCRRVFRNIRFRITNRVRNRVARTVSSSFGVEAVRTWYCTFHNSRDWHISMHLQRRGLDEPFISGLGNELMYPHDETAPIEDWINCLCYIDITFEGKPDIDNGRATLRKDVEQSGRSSK